MKVKCLYNTGDALRKYEYQSMARTILGRFGATSITQYNELDIGRNYIVMGIIIFETYQGYLIDDGEFIFVCPCQLFEITDDKLNPNWHFRITEQTEDIYPFVQAIFGYYEFCFDKNSYLNLIIEKEIEYQKIYFKRKKEVEDLNKI